MKWTVTCLFMIFSNVYGERWIIFGGYVNVEGGPDTKPLDSVELLTLDNEGEQTQNHLHFIWKTWSGRYSEANKWCSKPQASLPRPLDSAAVAWVDTWQFLDGMIAPGNINTTFSSAHYSTAWARVLICGGQLLVNNIHPLNMCTPRWRHNLQYHQRLLVVLTSSRRVLQGSPDAAWKVRSCGCQFTRSK